MFHIQHQKYMGLMFSEHLKRFVLRDRNHASVFGWSISNENKPVILHVYNRPELMPQQKKAWEDWRDIVRANDPTRPWISADGEDDGRVWGAMSRISPIMVSLVISIMILTSKCI